MVQICCFHTAKSNVALYDEAAVNLCAVDNRAGYDCEISHIVRPDFLTRAEQSCDIHSILQDTADAMILASKNADAVLLTCSTLGAAVNIANNQSEKFFFRADEQLARQAAKLKGKIAAFCTVKTTLSPTQQIFGAQQFNKENSFDLIFIEGAWDLFKAQQFDDYMSLIAKAANDALKRDYENIVLVQSSMMKAAQLIDHPHVLTAPHTSLKAVIDHLFK